MSMKENDKTSLNRKGTGKMKIALSVWQDRISTVFDAADQLLVLETSNGSESRRSTARLTSEDGPARATQLREMGVDALICGAISRPQEASIAAAGITVHPFVRGAVQDVVNAYEKGLLHTAAFALPGCQGRGMCAGRSKGRSRGAGCLRRQPQ